jgi:hypothetical protein
MKVNLHYIILVTLSLGLFTSCSSSTKTKKEQVVSKIHPKNDTTSKNNLSSEKPILEIDRSKKVAIGYYETYEKLPKLTFDTITEKEFLSIKQKKFIQSLKPLQDNNFFYVETAIQKHKFKQYKDYGGKENWSGFEYLGYYHNLKLYAITENSTDESMGFGKLFLIDSLNNYIYNIISFGDGSVELPIPSINNKYFVYYYNSVYEHKNCQIGILKINDKSHPKNFLTEYASYKSEEFAIEKIVWKTDNIFYVKGYEEIYENKEWVKKYKYYKTELK